MSEEKIIQMFRSELTEEELKKRAIIFQEFLRSLEITEEQQEKIIEFRFTDINY